MSESASLPCSPTPTTIKHWCIEHFSKLEYIESIFFRFDFPHHVWNEPTFEFIFIPTGYHSHVRDRARLVVEHQRSFGDEKDIPEKYRNKDAYFECSFIDGKGEKCHTQGKDVRNQLLIDN